MQHYVFTRRNTLAFLLIISTALLARDFKSQTVTIVSYNVENLFDAQDDANKDDAEFLPTSQKHWTYQRYKTKLGHISQVIADIGNGTPPMLVALCEVENDYCLQGLTRHSPLAQFKYSYIHHEGSDNRGIDVALLYQPKQFQPITKVFYKIVPTTHPTREILYTKGVLPNNDTLHVFVVHAPSRANKPSSRIKVTTFLRKLCDNISAKYQTPQNILIMGDFNDTPRDESLSIHLNAIDPQSYKTNNSSNTLYNLCYHTKGKLAVASHRYHGEWNQLDNIIVSQSLLNQSSSTYATTSTASIFDPSYLLVRDKRNLGYKPARTYVGPRYFPNGYSDHLPIFFQLTLK